MGILVATTWAASISDCDSQTQLFVETDCKNVDYFLAGHHSNLGWQGQQILADLQHIRHHYSSIIYLYIPRSCITVSHLLAKKAMNPHPHI